MSYHISKKIQIKKYVIKINYGSIFNIAQLNTIIYDNGGRTVTKNFEQPKPKKSPITIILLAS